MEMLLSLIIVAFIFYPASAAKNCTNFKGEEIQPGKKFYPKADEPCYQCVCDNGLPSACIAVRCSPPKCELFKVIDEECCHYECVEMPKLPNGTHSEIPNKNGMHTNLSLRLAIIAVTICLVLILILIMVNRLRQKRLVIMMRRTRMNSDEDGAVAYVTHCDSVDLGDTFPPYDEPPPPYTPPKPMNGSMFSPPPYSEVGEQNNNGTITDQNGTSSCPPYTQHMQLQTQEDSLPQTHNSSCNLNNSSISSTNCQKNCPSKPWQRPRWKANYCFPKEESKATKCETHLANCTSGNFAGKSKNLLLFGVNKKSAARKENRYGDKDKATLDCAVKLLPVQEDPSTHDFLKPKQSMTVKFSTQGDASATASLLSA